ncbi:AmmeMemoRadiSam system protein A [Desulfonatronovibrio magnus]|uniref:AmmeMemoRadiSam system protein A n=1 Tax=Desulfonatronovibrio magnus TaxID=698827 RepID=UPI0005EB8B6E|nr:AmmeMemoRadiSam system protein A [Desulfonatronovibrio magnus]
MSDFTFELSAQEKDYLKQLAWLSIKVAFEENINYPEPPTEKMKEKLGAFVTLKIKGKLRGCIGHIIGDKPLWKTIIRMASQAAFHDPRFPPLQKAELNSINLEISILSPLSKVDNPQDIVPGKHGLLIRQGAHSGLLLPQVAVEWKWDRNTFLANTCRKAGLLDNCWQDPNTEIFWFQAAVF